MKVCMKNHQNVNLEAIDLRSLKPAYPSHFTGLIPLNHQPTLSFLSQSHQSVLFCCCPHPKPSPSRPFHRSFEQHREKKKAQSKLSYQPLTIAIPFFRLPLTIKRFAFRHKARY
jgi:hypothetical protein